MDIQYSIVVPVYNEKEVLPLYYEKMTEAMETLQEAYEILFINDGSKDETPFCLNELAKKDERVKVIHFSRNFGQQAAILAGLKNAKGNAVVVMDCDLQDPPYVVLQMIEQWKQGFEVVSAVHKKRAGESFLKKWTAHVYYRFLDRISEVILPKDAGEFKLYDRRAVDVMISLGEHNRYQRGIATWVGFRQKEIAFDRESRLAGHSKFTWKKMFRLAGDGILSNSIYPLFLAMKWGMTISVLSLITFLTFIILVCCQVSLPLVAWLFPTITLMGSVILIAVGFGHLYVRRIYDEVRGRPNYIISQTENMEKSE